MNLRRVLLLYLVVSPYSLFGQTTNEVQISLTPLVSYFADVPGLYSVARTPDLVVPSWTNVHSRYVSMTGTISWAETDPTVGMAFYCVVVRTNGYVLSDDFEIDHGWYDLSSSSWTATVYSGTWSGRNYFTLDNPSYSHSGSRAFAAFNPSTSDSYIEFPTVNNATQVTFWVKSFGGTRSLTLQVFNGESWVNIDYFNSSTNYTQRSTEILYVFPNQRIRIGPGNSYSVNGTLVIDDVAIYVR
jgi:hypothetical protein